MPFVLADRVKETSNTTGTGTFVLAGPSTGFQSFAVIGDGNTTYYTIQNPGTNEWEVGIGTYYSANTSIVRTTVFSSSNANSVVSFSSGVKDVFVTYPSENAVTTLIANTFTNNQVISVNSSSNALTITQTGAGNALVVEDEANPDATPFVVDASGNVGIGQSPPSNSHLAVRGTHASSSGFAQAVYAAGLVDSSTTTRAEGFLSGIGTADAAFTCPSLSQFYATQGTITGGSRTAVTAQYGFHAASTLTGATNNYGFFSNIASGTGRWNFYANGTADNYFAGSVAIGATPDGTNKVLLGGTLPSSASNSGGYRSFGVVPSTTTGTNVNFDSVATTQAASFVLGNFTHFRAIQSTIGASSSITGQYGFFVDGSLTGATNNYGFYSNIASGTGRWNFYANGTAKNLFAGQTSIGGLEGAESLRVGPVASAVNRIEAFGAVTGNSPYIFANGSDTNVNLTIYSKGASGIFLDTNVSTATAFGIELGASTTVNRDTYIDFHSSSGTDYDFRLIRNNGVNGSAEYTNAGTAGHVFRTNAASQQFTVAHTASAVNYLQATGSATGNAVAISAQGNDANVSISIAAKGSGNVTVSGDLTANLTTTTSGPFDSGTGATWTNPRTRATWAKIELWGAGGGGGGSASGGAGGGGGGGAYFSVTVPFSYLGTTETYTVGGGGANVSTNTNGGAGGNTTFTVSNWPGGSKTFTAYGGGGGGGAASTSGYAGGGGGGVLSAGGTAAATVQGQGGQPLSAAQGSGGGNEGYGGGAGSAAQATQGGVAYYGGGGGGNGENGTGTGTTGLGGNSVYGGGGGGGGNDSGTVRCPGGTSVFGGKGGDGGYGNNTTPAQDGTVPGGGGGGSDLGTAGSGNGASGRVLITIW